MTFNPNPSLTQQIADFLEHEIIVGKLKDFERIQEIKYATLLKVSRNSLREALIILERRNLIIISPRKGAFVTALSVIDLKNLFDLIGHLYILLARRTAELWEDNDATTMLAAASQIAELSQSRDQEQFINVVVKFPELLFPIVKNFYLETAIRNLQPACARALYRVLQINEKEMDNFLDFVHGVVGGIAERDKKAIERTILNFVKVMKTQFPIYFKEEHAS